MRSVVAIILACTGALVCAGPGNGQTLLHLPGPFHVGDAPAPPPCEPGDFERYPWIRTFELDAVPESAYLTVRYADANDRPVNVRVNGTVVFTFSIQPCCDCTQYEESGEVIFDPSVLQLGLNTVEVNVDDGEPQDDDVFFEELKIIGPGLDYYYDSTADPVAQEALQEAFLRDVGGELDLVDFDEAPEGPVEGTEWEDRGAIFMPLAAGSTLRVHPADAGQAPHSAPHDLATINQANDSSIQIDLDPPAAAFGIWLIDSELTSADEGILFFDDAGNQIGSLPMPATGYITSGPEANFFVGATSPGATRIARVQILESSNESPSEGVPLDDLRFSGALGACCLPQGACQVATRTTCAVDLGAFQGVGTGCEPSPCPAPGACCLNGGCQILMSFACTSAGGIPGAEGTVCEPRVCCAGDADCDGLADDWEVQGIPIANGTERYQLPGADPKHKDLYVEIDAMTGRAPFESALPAVVASFANSPVPNLDGSDGIALHIVGNDCVTCIDDGDLDDVAWPNDYWGEFDAVKMDYFGTAAERQSSDWDDVRVAKASGYRYGVFANWYGTTEGGLPNTSSGLAERSGNDFFVTLGDFWPGIGADEQAATLMHELGHTLGLCHGGECGSNQEGVNCKPNYFSVMNYTWQLPTQNLNGTADHALYRASWRLDYSRGSLLNLNESNLFESTGIGASEELWVPVGPPGGATNVDPKIVRMDTRLDWNRDGDTDDGAVAADANYLKGIGGCGPQEGQNLEGYDDWRHLQFLPENEAWEDRPFQVREDLDELNYESFQELSRLEFDCNGNGIPDHIEIDDGVVADENANGVPDICEETDTVGIPEVTDGAGSSIDLWISPNPGRGPRMVHLNGPGAGTARVWLCDASGRVVKTIFRGRIASGVQLFTWDGLGREGRELPSGIYFLAAAWNDRQASRTVVIVR